MAVKPKIRTLTNNSKDVLNAIKNNASVNYKNVVPYATDSVESLRTIGAVIVDSPNLRNEFINSLLNRIAFTVAKSALFSNPWAMFKRGILETGETIEEIFVNLAKPFQYDPDGSVTTVFKREIPDVKTAFHIMNYQKFYKETIERNTIKLAFASWGAMDDFIQKIIGAMYVSANYDEYQTMKYMLGRQILDGFMTPINVGEVSRDTAHDISITIKEASNNMEFMSATYNPMGVPNVSNKDRQYLILSTKFDAICDIEVLAMAFNIDKAQLSGRRVLVDGFGNVDSARLAELFAGDDTYKAFTEEEKKALDAIPGVLVDEDYFMIYDNLLEFADMSNGEGLYYNYWLHTWKTFSASPFANRAVFVPTASTVDTVTVTPSAVTLTPGSSFGLGVEVKTSGFASKQVVWTSSDETKATVSQTGVVTVLPEATDTVTITATSVVDSTKKSECTVTIQSAE